uniref:Perlucin-like protein n=1 Tax=Crassostrea virginica TaxID=6565 RepID=A0A8B8B9G2_CRAVI
YKRNTVFIVILEHWSFEILSILLAISFFQGVALQSQCPNGWTRRENSCYLFVTHVANDWTESEFFCQLLHSNLVEIETSEENAFVQKEAIRHSFENRDSHGFWIGGTDAINEGEWTWVTSGSNFTYSNWARDFPTIIAATRTARNFTKTAIFSGMMRSVITG